MEAMERQRDEQLREMSTVRSTVREQQQRQSDRRQRKHDHSAAAAGDLDQDGELLLKERVRLSMAQKQASNEVW